MAYEFNADEILAMAQELEKNGAAFYREAASHTSNAGYKKLLQDLAHMEDDHERTFAALRRTLKDSETSGTTFDPDDEARGYLSSFMQMRVFFEKKIDTTSMMEVFRAAVEAERDSVAFYTGIRDLVPERLGKSRVDVIIHEEMAHLRLLAAELLAAQKAGA